ncbi:MAG TPA: patatin-like phospholipase family protein [Bacillota bacterium]|nr:patatin-like phospholipase family protein [Bacillota bacterium]
MKANAVFEGGGVRGLALVGGLCGAESQGFTWHKVAGTSAGAILAALVAAGYRGQEIKNLMENVDLTRFKDPMLYGKLPLIGPMLSLLGGQGLYKGDYFTQWLRDKLAARGVYNFGDLWDRKAAARGEPNPRKLQVIAADISRGKILVLPQDIADFGIEPENLEVAAAVRMSMSIPLFYRPVEWQYETSDENQVSAYVVDGGILSNFPVWLFDNEGSGNPTFGFRLVGKGNQAKPRDIRGPVSLLTAVVYTMMDAHDRKVIEESDFARTISIPTLGVGVTDFEISRQKKQALFRSGYQAATDFFRTWSYPAYREIYLQQGQHKPK